MIQTFSEMNETLESETKRTESLKPFPLRNYQELDEI